MLLGSSSWWRRPRNTRDNVPRCPDVTGLEAGLGKEGIEESGPPRCSSSPALPPFFVSSPILVLQFLSSFAAAEGAASEGISSTLAQPLQLTVTFRFVKSCRGILGTAVAGIGAFCPCGPQATLYEVRALKHERCQ